MCGEIESNWYSPSDLILLQSDFFAVNDTRWCKPGNILKVAYFLTRHKLLKRVKPPISSSKLVGKRSSWLKKKTMSSDNQCHSGCEIIPILRSMSLIPRLPGLRSSRQVLLLSENYQRDLEDFGLGWD